MGRIKHLLRSLVWGAVLSALSGTFAFADRTDPSTLGELCNKAIRSLDKSSAGDTRATPTTDVVPLRRSNTGNSTTGEHLPLGGAVTGEHFPVSHSATGEHLPVSRSSTGEHLPQNDTSSSVNSSGSLDVGSSGALTRDPFTHPEVQSAIADAQAAGMTPTGRIEVGGQAVAIQVRDKDGNLRAVYASRNSKNLRWRARVADAAGQKADDLMIPVQRLDVNPKRIHSPWIEARTIHDELSNPELFGPTANPGNILDFWDIMLESLDALHQSGILHRDIKSEHLHVTVTGRDKRTGEITDFSVRFNDFGLSGLKDEGEWVLPPGVGVISGTPSYMSGRALVGNVGIHPDLDAARIVFNETALGLPIDDEKLDNNVYWRTIGKKKFRKLRGSSDTVDPRVHYALAMIPHFPARDSQSLRRLIAAAQVAIAGESARDALHPQLRRTLDRFRSYTGVPGPDFKGKFLAAYGEEFEALARDSMKRAASGDRLGSEELAQMGIVLFTSTHLTKAFASDLKLSDEVKISMLNAVAERYQGTKLEAKEVRFGSPNPWINFEAFKQECEKFGIEVPESEIYRDSTIEPGMRLVTDPSFPGLPRRRTGTQ